MREASLHEIYAECPKGEPTTIPAPGVAQIAGKECCLNPLRSLLVVEIMRSGLPGHSWTRRHHNSACFVSRTNLDP